MLLLFFFNVIFLSFLFPFSSLHILFFSFHFLVCIKFGSLEMFNNITIWKRTQGIFFYKNITLLESSLEFAVYGLMMK